MINYNNNEKIKKEYEMYFFYRVSKYIYFLCNTKPKVDQ